MLNWTLYLNSKLDAIFNVIITKCINYEKNFTCNLRTPLLYDE